MSDEVRSSGWMAILKSYLKQAYFSQYISGFIAMLLVLKFVTELPNSQQNMDILAFDAVLIIAMLIVNVWLGRESMRNDNFSNAVRVEKARRDNPTVMQQMQASLARLENTLPGKEDLLALKEAVIKAGLAISLQQGELVLSEDKQKLRAEVANIDDEINKLANEYASNPDDVEPE